MKKVVSLFLVLLITVTAFSGCAREKTGLQGNTESSTLVADSSDKSEPIDFYVSDLSAGMYSSDFSVLLDKTVAEDFDSIDYSEVLDELEGKYANKSYKLGSGEYVLEGTFEKVLSGYYKTVQFKGDDCKFSVFSDSGKLAKYNYIDNRDPLEIDTTPIITLEEGKTIANNFLSSFLDLSKYESTGKGWASPTDSLYYYNYVRLVDGIRTPESISVIVEGWSGKVHEYEGSHIDEYADISLPDGFDVSVMNNTAVDKFEKEVEKKIGSVIDNVTSDKEQCRLYLDEDGNLYLESLINCQTDGQSASFYVHSLINK